MPRIFINQKVIKSGFALSLIGASILLPAQAEVIVEPVDYDTVIGVNGQSIDLDSDKFIFSDCGWT
ncbi:hypothetical protein [Moritella sp. 28]|uniref:hypothetical protein n=1 Tax=Moritella sp. 28 TaxID=2746232 RepID=UPI001BABBA21|nr:hypothetical protein [Moritella sp. 28]QUM86228.1 hypothetical protein HWV02_17790 [Moritella sp. 28]